METSVSILKHIKDDVCPVCGVPPVNDWIHSMDHKIFEFIHGRDEQRTFLCGSSLRWDGQHGVVLRLVACPQDPNEKKRRANRKKLLEDLRDLALHSEVDDDARIRLLGELKDWARMWQVEFDARLRDDHD